MSLTRRTFVAAAAVSLLGSAAFVALPAMAATNFTASGYKKLLESGKPFLLGVHTSWCSTCAVQRRVVNALKKSAPYNKLKVVEMDWDKYRGSKIGKELKIPRRSTLIMYSDGKEVGRIIAGTSSSQIKGLIDKGI